MYFTSISYLIKGWKLGPEEFAFTAEVDQHPYLLAPLWDVPCFCLNFAFSIY